jgi:hypothetical protein
MFQYDTVCVIHIKKDDIVIPVPINYKELAMVHYMRKGLKGDALKNKLGISRRTIYNTTCMLKSKLHVITLEELKSKFDGIDCESLLFGVACESN